MPPALPAREPGRRTRPPISQAFCRYPASGPGLIQALPPAFKLLKYAYALADYVW